MSCVILTKRWHFQDFQRYQEYQDCVRQSSPYGTLSYDDLENIVCGIPTNASSPKKPSEAPSQHTPNATPSTHACTTHNTSDQAQCADCDSNGSYESSPKDISQDNDSSEETTCVDSDHEDDVLAQAAAVSEKRTAAPKFRLPAAVRPVSEVESRKEDGKGRPRQDSQVVALTPKPTRSGLVDVMEDLRKLEAEIAAPIPGMRGRRRPSSAPSMRTDDQRRAWVEWMRVELATFDVDEESHETNPKASNTQWTTPDLGMTAETAHQCQRIWRATEQRKRDSWQLWEAPGRVRSFHGPSLVQSGVDYYCHSYKPTYEVAKPGKELVLQSLMGLKPQERIAALRKSRLLR